VLAPEVIWRNLLLYDFDIHEFLRLRCRYPRERSQSRPSPREAPLSGYINYDSEPSGCNNKLDGLSDRTDRRLSPLVLLIKSLDETARKHGLG